MSRVRPESGHLSSRGQPSRMVNPQISTLRQRLRPRAMSTQMPSRRPRGAMAGSPCRASPMSSPASACPVTARASASLGASLATSLANRTDSAQCALSLGRGHGLRGIAWTHDRSCPGAVGRSLPAALDPVFGTYQDGEARLGARTVDAVSPASQRSCRTCPRLYGRSCGSANLSGSRQSKRSSRPREPSGSV
jgi:hypothetical protein